jgi:hypothetical protein
MELQLVPATERVAADGAAGLRERLSGRARENYAKIMRAEMRIVYSAPFVAQVIGQALEEDSIARNRALEEREQQEPCAARLTQPRESSS